MSDPFHVPYELRRGQRSDDEKASIASAVEIMGVVATDLGLDDLSTIDLLDVGCGVKFTQAVLNEGVPIGSYTGLDIAADLISYLQEQVADPRLSFFHTDWHNERYNPDGQPMTADTTLPIGDQQFDAITLFSVMTHLVPEDFRNLLAILRPHLREGGSLIFSAFLDQTSPGGHGYMDALVRQLGPEAQGSVDGFRDLDPEIPLKWAMYTEERARELIADAGWTVDALKDPIPVIQHRFICVPS